MADAVNLSLENVVREAEEFVKSGSFSDVEVKYIFQKRSRFEYMLRRREAPPARFLSYIKFETDLHKLHKLRKVWDSFPSQFSTVRIANTPLPCYLPEQYIFCFVSACQQ